MARLVKKTATGPMEVKVGDKSVWICMCGLSKKQPFCDGSHQQTANEEPNKVYHYNDDGGRLEVSE